MAFVEPTHHDLRNLLQTRFEPSVRIHHRLRENREEFGREVLHGLSVPSPLVVPASGEGCDVVGLKAEHSSCDLGTDHRRNRSFFGSARLALRPFPYRDIARRSPALQFKGASVRGRTLLFEPVWWIPYD